MSSLPKELEFEKLSDDEKYHRAVPGYMKRLRDLDEAIHERYSDDGLDLIRQVSRDFGTTVGTNVKLDTGEKKDYSNALIYAHSWDPEGTRLLSHGAYFEGAGNSRGARFFFC